MSDELRALADGFEIPSRDVWVEAVEQTLGGKPIGRLIRATDDGVEIQPLYRAEEHDTSADPVGLPGRPPYVRGAGAGRGWAVRQAHAHPDLSAANDQILHETLRGVTQLHVRLDHATRIGTPGQGDGVARDGMPILTLDDLDQVLANVELGQVPVAFDSGASYLAVGALVLALLERRGVAADAAVVLRADPLGTLAATGALPVDLDTALGWLGRLAMAIIDRAPRAITAGVDASVYFDAGASHAQEVACAVATGIVYLRALTDAGLDVDTAARQIEFTLAAGTDQFTTIAKLRAARRLWARVVEASGGSPEAQAMRLHAVTARRVMTRHDPWVNLLRTTVACFAAGVGGAEAITVRPFTEALGEPDGFARRIARNTQLILLEESHLGTVVDPAGGSWYVEHLTDEFAVSAWDEVQAIERAGGMAAALLDGGVAERIGAVRSARAERVARRKDPVTGVSEFPDIHEEPVDTAEVDRERLRTETIDRADGMKLSLGSDEVAATLDAVRAGATLADVMDELRGGAVDMEPFALHRLAAGFEALREASDRVLASTGGRPTVFLANLGPIAEHTARATFARNFFEAGGIEAVSNDGFDESKAAAAAFTSSGARIACICSSDTRYAEQAAAVAEALRVSGAERVYLAGRPGEGYEDAADEAIHVGCDALGILRRAHALLGLDDGGTR